MKCEKCGKNEANVRYTEIINGSRKEIRVCEKCAKEMGIDNVGFDMPFSFSNIFSDFFEEPSIGLLPNLKKENTICKTCDDTFNTLLNTGLLGCEDCYSEFESKLDPLLKKIQASNRHVGRKSKNEEKINKDIIEVNEEKAHEEKKEETKKVLSINEQIEELSKKLNEAIAKEEYEEAAKIRDEINRINKGE